MPQIRIPPILRPDVSGSRSVVVEGETVRNALRALLAEYPVLEGRVLVDDTLPAYLNVFVDGNDVRSLNGLDTEVGEETAILLMPAVAGGRTRTYTAR